MSAMEFRSRLVASCTVTLILAVFCPFANAVSGTNNTTLPNAKTQQSTVARTQDGTTSQAVSPACRAKNGDQVSRCFGWALDYLKISTKTRNSYRFKDLWFSDDSTTLAASMVAQDICYRRVILDLSRKKVLYPSVDRIPKSNDLHYPIISACFNSTRNVWNLLSGDRSFVIESINASTGAVIRIDSNVDSLVFSYDEPKSIIPAMCDSLSRLAK
jgi:hypothetical protein